MFSAAWVAGPPVAAVVISGAGGHALVAGNGIVGALNLLASVVLQRSTRTPSAAGTVVPIGTPARTLVPRATIALFVAAFAVLQATNSASVAVTTLIVTRTLHLTPCGVVRHWESRPGWRCPGLLLLGRASRRWGDVQLLSLACLAGIAYYLGVSITPNGYVLVALQLLNAGFVAVMAGVGLTLFQSIIAGPGAAAGLLSNAQRGGALLSGPLIGVGAVLGGGLRTVFVAAAVVASVSLGLFRLTARRLPRHSTPETVQAPSPPSPT